MFLQVGEATQQEQDSDDLMSQSQVDLGTSPGWEASEAEERMKGGPVGDLKDRETGRPGSRTSERKGKGLKESNSDGSLNQQMTLKEQMEVRIFVVEFPPQS